MTPSAQVQGIIGTWIAAVVVLASAQAPARVTVLGQVVHAVTGRPIAGAEVSLNDGAPPPNAKRKTVSGDDGRFVFDNIPSGTYYVFASKPGFFTAGLNDDADHGASDELVIAWPGPAPITMKLRPHGAIVGTVSDDAGRPVAGAKIAALTRKEMWPSWGKRLTWVQPFEIKTVVTDERGRYAIEAVDAGEYLIEVNAAALVIAGAQPSTFGTTYSPGADRIADAVPVTLGLGDRHVADMQIHAKPAFDLAGVVEVPAADTDSVYVLLFIVDGRVEHVRRLVTEQWLNADRLFKFSRLPPGDYLLTASVNDQFWGEQRVTVGDRSLEDVHLVLAPAPVVSGRVIWEGTDRPPDRSAFFRPATVLGGDRLLAEERARLATEFPLALVEMLPVGSSVPGEPPRSYGAVWASATTFTLTAPPGQYLAGHASGTGWYLKSFRIDGHEATEEPVEIESHVRDAVMTLTRAVGEVRGPVVTPAGALDPWCTVILFSPNPRVWPGVHATTGRQVYEVLADRAGRYTIQGVIPGEYYLAATSNTTAVDEDLLRLLAVSAMRVQVPAGVPIDRTLIRER